MPKYLSAPTFRNHCEFVRDWEEIREKLDNHAIIKEEYEDWKHIWDNSTWIKTNDDKSPYTEK